MADARARVLLVIDEMEVGGTQRQLVQLARALDPQRFALELAWFREPSFLLQELADAGVVLHHVPKRGAVDLRFTLGLHRLLARGRYDLVQAFSFTSELWCAVALSMPGTLRRMPFVSSIRGTYEWYSPRQWTIKRAVSRRSARIVANSRAGAAYAAPRLGLDLDAIEVVPNAVDVDPRDADAAARRALRAEAGAGADDFLLLFVGRLVDHKNVETLLDALPLLAGSRRVCTAIVGDGPLGPALRARAAARAGAAPIAWLGERRDVGAWMQAADALVLPSWREGLSNVILEAMAHARPVLASRAGGNLESVVQHQTGLFFDPADATDIARAIDTLARDPAACSRMGAAGRERVQRVFGRAALGEHMGRIYDEVLERDAPVLGPSLQRENA